jgi:ABC-type Na+ transport system ATPase subunit NatA
MKRITYLAAIVVGVLAWAAPAHAAAESFTGIVKAVSDSSITVEHGTVSTAFTVNGSTHLTVKGATAKTKTARAAGKSGLTVPDAVRVGDQVTVKYAEQGAGRVASDIHVLVSLATK